MDSSYGVKAMAAPAEFLNNVDKSSFGHDGYSRRVAKPWGYELIFTSETSAYTFKLMHINAGKRQSLQVHDAKTETYLVRNGRAAILIENSKGEMEQIELESNHGYTTQVGQRHRLIGLTDTDILEASTPENGTTWRLEDDFARPDETEELRAAPNRGWKA
jgi:mannose-6-phosphate isomerase-like protein (cupin superfamily)